MLVFGFNSVLLVNQPLRFCFYLLFTAAKRFSSTPIYVTSSRCLWQDLVTGIGDLHQTCRFGLLASFHGLPSTPSLSVPPVSCHPESHPNRPARPVPPDSSALRRFSASPAAPFRCTARQRQPCPCLCSGASTWAVCPR